MELTKQEKIPRIMITMKCYEGCKYCSTPYVPIPEVDGNYWIDLINSQPYTEVRFSGGEPLLYNDLFMIINNIDIPYWIYTNLRFWMREYFELIDKDRCTFFVSYHPKENITPNVFIEKVLEIYQKGYNISVHYVDWKGYNKTEKYYIKRVKEELEEFGLKLNANSDQQEVKLPDNHTKCHIDRTLFGPDGKRYPCMKLLQEQIGNIPLTHYEGINCNRVDCMPCNREAIIAENCWEV